MYLQEETIFTSKQVIIDADCKKGDLIVLLKDKGENIVQLNGKIILRLSPGHRMIRFTKNYFCLLEQSTLSFYTLTGEFVSEYEVGSNVHELFPYQEGILCIYGDEGVYGKGAGKNLLNYVSPFQNPESFYSIAVQHNLSYDTLFARYKPYACMNPPRNELVLLNEHLKKERTLEIPFDTGNVMAFALSYPYSVFIEENKLIAWNIETTERIVEYDKEFIGSTRAIFHRHDCLFIETSDYKIRVFKLIEENGFD